ncbi:fungal-specific transcription factor domain-containing protein [Ilyonectria destructans]|nr:fungal-specific transcription factor domain-containing protein [Ilyonectria destructans]
MPATGATLLKSTCHATNRTCQLLTKESRKRAPRACLQCRRRKVRCDVAFSGLPCRNCVLDDIGCVITERKLKGASATLLPPVTNYGEQAEDLIDGEPNCVDAPSMGDIATSTTGDLCDGTCPLAGHSAPTISPSMDGLEFLKSTDSHLEDRPFYSDLLLDREMFLGGDYCVSLYHNDDSYASDLPFINLPDLSRLSLHEISSLRLQKCLWLPPKLILDEFVRQYFLHVHPVVPFLDEKHFWDLYGHKNVYDNIPDKIPMVLFQAMLFSACSFVSQPIVEALGFSCLRSASAKLYIRAKILYDMRTESSSLVLAQTAILLTFLPFSYGVGPTRPNTMWLRTAIDHARSAHTDHVMSSRGVSCDKNNQIKQASSLKRLWWCCILRDKTLSLGLQRSIQITQSCRPPELSDFEDEIGSSLVYDSHTQRRLYSIFIRTMELCTVLTDLLPLVQSEDDVYSGHTLKSSEQAKLVSCKSALENWYLKTRRDHPLPRGADGFQHQSVIIQTTFMYIFYHTAKLSLHSKDILVTLFLSKEESLSSLKVLEKSIEARDAAISITDCLRESVQLGIVRYFPISIVSFIAMPLLMHILDHKIQHRGDKSQKAVASHYRLQALIHAMKQYRLQYHGVESISEVIRLVVDFAELNYQVKPPGTTSEWTDVIICRPSQFIQLTMILKASLSQAKSPNQAFQQSLNNILTSVPTLTDSLYSVPNMQDFDVFPLATASDGQAGTTSSPTATDVSNHDVSVVFDDFVADERYPSLTEIKYPGRTADAPPEVRESPDIVYQDDTGNRRSTSESSITPGVLDFINAISCFDQDTNDEIETGFVNTLVGVDKA